MSNAYAYHRERARVRAILAREGPEREATPEDVCRALVRMADRGYSLHQLDQLFEAARAALANQK